MDDTIFVEDRTDNVLVSSPTIGPTIEDTISIVTVTPPDPSSVTVGEVPAALVTVVTPGISGSSSGGTGGINVGDTFDEAFTLTNMIAGSGQEVDASAITSGKIGRLWAVVATASVPLKLEAEFVNGSRVIRGTIITQAGVPAIFQAPDPRFLKLIGDGAAHFGAKVTNMSPAQTSDLKVVIYYDEVDS